MKSHGSLLFVIGTLATLALFGCAQPGQENFKTGQTLSSKNLWEEAIPYYERAAAQHPEKPEYGRALEKAKKEAAKARFEKARKMIEAYPEPNMAVLNLVLDGIAIAGTFDPTNPEISSFREEVAEKREKLLEEIKGLYEDSNTAIRNQDWFEALEKLGQIRKLYPDYEDTESKLSEVKREGIRYCYEQGLAFGKNEQWEMAAKAFKLVLEIDPDYRDTQKLYEQAIAKDTMDYYLEKGKQMAEAKQWDKAIFLIRKAMDHDLDNEELYRYLETLKAHAGLDSLSRAAKSTSQERLETAVNQMKRALEYDPSLRGSSFAKEILGDLARRLYEKAEKYAAGHKWGNALVWMEKLRQIDPEYRDVSHRVQAAREGITSRIKKSTAVLDSPSPEVYFEEAQQLRIGGRDEEAIEKYMDAIFDEKLKGVSTPISIKSRQMIQQLIEDG